MIMGPQSLPLTLSKIGSEGASSGGGGGSSSTPAGNSDGSSSTNTLDGRALFDKNLEISKDLDTNSLISKYDIQPSALDAIKQRFPLINPRDVSQSVVFYVSSYNLKCKALIELTAL